MLGLKQSDLQYIINIIKEYNAIDEAIIFGSRAKGNYKKGSDVDLALKGKQLEQIVTEISGKLNDEGPLPYKIDVLDYDAITNPNLKDHIDRIGIKIYSNASYI